MASRIEVSETDLDTQTQKAAAALNSAEYDGKIVVVVWEHRQVAGGSGKPATGVHHFVGGTGKYTSITGQADFTSIPVKSSAELRTRSDPCILCLKRG